MLFNINRQHSGDFQNISIPDRAKLIGKEWQALTAEEKSVSFEFVVHDGISLTTLLQKYMNLSQDESRRYSSEHTDVYGYAPPHQDSGLQAASATA